MRLHVVVIPEFRVSEISGTQDFRHRAPHALGPGSELRSGRDDSGAYP
jgi:hypothetical protein